MKHSTSRPTISEQKRFSEMMSLGCVACAQLGLWVAAQEAHHIIRANRRLGHFYSIPLCSGHHRGIWSIAQKFAIPKEKQVAISDGSKAFCRIYPPERQLWEQVQDRLKLPKLWPISKVQEENP